MNEYTEYMGRELKLQRDHTRLATECGALRDSLRRLLPIEEDAGNLDREQILNTAVALDQSLVELAEIDKRLAVVRRYLGR